MISNQIIQTSIDELKTITKVDIYVFDLDGIKVAATTEDIEISREIITGFAASPADSQVVGGYHFLKVLDDSEVAYVLASRSNNDDAYMVGKIAVSQIQNLIIAYKERFDRNNFFQNLILDNLLLRDRESYIWLRRDWKKTAAAWSCYEACSAARTVTILPQWMKRILS